MRNVEPKTWDTVRPGMVEGLASTNGIYSAWNWSNGQYDYFEGPASQRPSYGDEIKPPPAQNAFGSALGEDPDRSSRSMPRTARYVGSGPVALGEIVAVVESADGVSPWMGVVLALVIPSALLWATVKLGDFFGVYPEDADVEF